jgi:phospholipid-binding lipoprotein MlaA
LHTWRNKSARRSPGWLAVVLGTALLAGGCATPPPADDPDAVAAFREANDPYEPLNRGIFEINMFLDRIVLKPVAYVYKEGVPEPARNWVTNALNNFRSPIVLINDLLQGEFTRANDTLLRLMMNTGFGLGGILDIATEFGIPDHEEDFGQTLAVYGLGEGPYLVLPLLGPTNPRDLAGFVVDTAFDPSTYIKYVAAVDSFGPSKFAGSAVSNRAERYDQINDLQKSSLDFYATVRSLYRQKRNDEIRNGRPALDRQAWEPEPAAASAAAGSDAPKGSNEQ